MPTVLLAAIHNGELEAAPARRVITEFTDVGVVQRVIEVTAQPALDDTPNASSLRQWRRTQRLLEEEWRVHRGIASIRRRLLGVGGEALFRVRLRTSRRFAETAWLARQVESFVTAKHIAAWRTFVDSPEDDLLVIESDATLLDNSMSAFREVIAAEAGSADAQYVNLAGGLDHGSIAVQHLVRTRDASTITFSKPVTNTSCAYVLNHAFVRDILGFLERQSAAQALGIDWLFNAYFLDADKRGFEIACLHADPPALGHGSLTGVTQSWHPDR